MRRILFLILSLLVAPQAYAASDVLVDKVWMRESVPGQTAATVQLNLYVTRDATLLGVSSPLAASGEIRHVMKRSGKMQQRTLRDLKLAGHSNTLFGERGLYLMLVGLNQPLNVGDKVPVTLSLKIGGKTRDIEVQAAVRALELSYKHYNDPAVMDHQ
ncbi:MAG: copper chaperone PCu(A)C [Gammaproteobacteria bacterium]|nr:copper chaperone PCu(A)C [Sideroxydans sp.]MBU3903707.1 copper chaperone PCu(A)C [Gammaproteobacteria bacterium]MBU4045605.1 copper chaperone PCu(A)C [Gammaproteobacteria bacterium]MBU4150167.1 copper chaperone PCu(A)C [Gammaproteobacteria bacterium]